MRRLLLSALLLVTACGDSATGTLVVEPGDAAGFTTVRGEGFSIAIPADWLILDKETFDAGGAFAEVEASGLPVTADQLVAIFEQGGMLFALDVADAHPEFVDNINVLRLPPLGVSVDGMADLVRSELAASGIPLDRSGVAQLPAGDSFFYEFGLPALGTEHITYAFAQGDYSWQVTLSALDVAPRRGVFERIMDSLRFEE